MEADWSIVFQDAGQPACSDRALVLLAVQIPYQILAGDNGTYAVAVPAVDAERAKFELWQYEQENQPVVKTTQTIKPDYRAAIPGVIAYLVVVVTVGWMAGNSWFGEDWFGAGRVDGALIRAGEWWRTVTALTLHGGIKHILGNIVFGSLFGLVAGGMVGPGVAWLVIVIAGALGNTLNVFLLDATHRAIGASTAVFATLGIVSGFVWKARLMAQDRWAWRLGPIVGGLALLAYTGTGDANTDVGAHLAGFVTGFASGMLVSKLPDLRQNKRLQLICGMLALTIVLIAWVIAMNNFG